MYSRKSPSHRKRGVIAVFSIVLMTVLCGFAALTLDLGAAMNARADLQDAADVSALSAAAAFATDDMMEVRFSSESAIHQVMSTGQTNATSQASVNPTFGLATTTLALNDITFGWLDLTSGSAALDTGAAPNDFNAVQVITRRTAESANGPVAAMFSRIFGNDSMEVVTRATAAFDDRMIGFDSNGSPNILPFSIHEDEYAADLAAGSDVYEHDSASGVFSGNDGIPEVNIFPHNLVPGNFGLLNIGQPNMGTPGLRDHIEDGVQPEDFEAEIGSAEILFYDNGNTQTYNIGGNPGIVSALLSSIETREGELVAYFLHDSVTEQGSSSVYRITNIVFGRLMDVRMTGAPSSRGIWIQPAAVSGGGVMIGDAPSSNGNAGRLVLAR